MKVTIGGDRIGAGNKNKVDLHDYGFSTFNLSRVFRTTANAGTLIPCFREICTKKDVIDIDITSFVRTIPTQGPLYGRFKCQIDFYYYPFRLGIGALHNNFVNIGSQMDKVKFPNIILRPYTKGLKNLKQGINNAFVINPIQQETDTLLSYLGIRGVGRASTSTGHRNSTLKNSQGTSNDVYRSFNAIGVLAYADIAKNFYVNLNEDSFCAISGTTINLDAAPLRINNGNAQGNYFNTNNIAISNPYSWNRITIQVQNTDITQDIKELLEQVTVFTLVFSKTKPSTEPTDLASIYKITLGQITELPSTTSEVQKLGNTNIFEYKFLDGEMRKFLESIYQKDFGASQDSVLQENFFFIVNTRNAPDVYVPTIKKYDINTFDDIRTSILSNCQIGERITIDDTTTEIEYLRDLVRCQTVNNTVYSEELNTKANIIDGVQYAGFIKNNGLILKSYLSDIFNNWIKSEWIEKINEETALNVNNPITMNALIMQKKLFNYRNRVALSGNTLEDWSDATWGESAQKFCESPMYIGGQAFEIVFDEVVSTAASGEQPLGELGGRGTIDNVRGGRVHFRVEEPGMMIGLLSITPRLDYFQGNDWDTYALESMEDLHKPELDKIGFQDLITEQMHALDTLISTDGQIQQFSAGKQPAYINYQTSYNRVYGDFAREQNYDYITVTRKYELPVSFNEYTQRNSVITNLTTIIDPRATNYLFASKDLNVQPFWVNIGFDVKARRKMSENQIPNL